jgi:sugar (pentulose or hexulose) kinase
MKRCLGIELGSTRIKAVLMDETYAAVASGGHDWENRLENGLWTYALEDAVAGVQDAYAKLAREYKARFGEDLTDLDAVGVSGMMHGYLAFDRNGTQSVPFRTWRNTVTERAAALLSERLDFNLPQRWSAAHLCQAALDGEPHIQTLAQATTLAGYIHERLGGRRCVGVGEASGMFPVDAATLTYDRRMAEAFRELTGFDVFAVFPEPLAAGRDAGRLSAEGANLLDPSGKLRPGAVLCPPEGDAGTGMAATNSVAPRRGNVSAGTSAFAMVVLERPLSRRYAEIDLVATPAGRPVAMAHANSCTSDLDAWVKLFGEAAALMGANFQKSELYDALYAAALGGEPDAGGLLSYNLYAGEPVLGLDAGRPLFTRAPDSRMSLANFMRVTLYAALATLSAGMDILTQREQVRLDVLLGHGGLFKTPGVGQRMMAAALNVPVAVQTTAGEGGAWGIALLAAYRAFGQGRTLEAFLDTVFARGESVRVEPDAADAAGFRAYLRRYRQGLPLQHAAGQLTMDN